MQHLIPKIVTKIQNKKVNLHSTKEVNLHTTFLYET